MHKLILFVCLSYLFLCSNSLYAKTNAIDNNTKPLTVMLDWFVNPDHASLFVAKQQGFFQQQGIKVKFIAPADPTDPPKLAAANKIDIAITYQPQLIVQVNAGLPLVRIATLIATPLNALVVRADNAIQSIKDLKHKKIGYSTGGIDTIMLKTLLNKNGLTLKDVELINVHYDLTQALLAKKIDAATGMMRNFELAQMRLAGQPGKAFYPEENGMPLYDELVLVTNKNNIHDPRLPKFLKAITQGIQYLINHPQASWKTFAKNHPELNNELNHQVWFTTLPRFALRPAALDKSRYQNYALFLKQQRLIKKTPELNSYAVELKY